MTKIEALELELKARYIVLGTKLCWRNVIRNKAGHYFNPALFSKHPQHVYELALGIVERKPVWLGDTLYNSSYGYAKTILVSNTELWDLIKDCVLSWEPPKAKTEEKVTLVR